MSLPILPPHPPNCTLPSRLAQKDDEFACWELNRDVWKHAGVQGRIRESFLFWQQGLTAELPVAEAMRTAAGAMAVHDARRLRGERNDAQAPRVVSVPNPHAADFLHRYRLPPHCPLLALVDPRTGEMLWSHVGRIGAQDLARRLGAWAEAHRWAGGGGGGGVGG